MTSDQKKQIIRNAVKQLAYQNQSQAMSDWITDRLSELPDRLSPNEIRKFAKAKGCKATFKGYDRLSGMKCVWVVSGDDIGGGVFQTDFECILCVLRGWYLLNIDENSESSKNNNWIKEGF